MRHPFLFDGGEELTTMGACWFVSYAYYDKINPAHDNWKRVTTWNNRRTVYNRTKHYHDYWLRQILLMSDANLSKNTLGLDPFTVKRMVRELL